MIKKNYSIIIVPHRYINVLDETKTGKYCVEFNTFRNNVIGREALDWWSYKCLEWCYYIVPKENEWYGDQKYLNVFPKKFKEVYVCDDIGFGLAPWNDKNILLDSKEGSKIFITDIKHEEKATLCFYHYAGVQFISKNLIKVSSRTKSKELHKEIFDNYVYNIVQKRNYINKKYKLKLSKDKKLPTNNIVFRFYQKYLMQIKHIRNINNIYNVKKYENC